MSRKLAVGLLVLEILTGCGGGRRHQTGYTEDGPAEPAELPTIRGPILPDSAFDIEWGHVQLPSTLPTDTTLSINLRLTNHGDALWPNADTQLASGRYAVRLSYRWLRSGQPSVEDYKERIDLPRPVPPGGSIDMAVSVLTPSTPGGYRLQFDLVQELVAWFQAKGAQPLIIPVTVQ